MHTTPFRQLEAEALAKMTPDERARFDAALDETGQGPETDYEALAARAERGELSVKPDTVLLGTAASAAAQHALMVATGTATLPEAMQQALARSHTEIEPEA